MAILSLVGLGLVVQPPRGFAGLAIAPGPLLAFRGEHPARRPHRDQAAIAEGLLDLGADVIGIDAQERRQRVQGSGTVARQEPQTESFRDYWQGMLSRGNDEASPPESRVRPCDPACR
jgi:hypothetical protein